MPNPLPTQLSGALFLAQRSAALLADEPRVGKTGAALIAADYIFAKSICIITTASGRAVWRRAVREWCVFERTDVAIVGWPEMTVAAKRAALQRPWDLLILDESHYAKNFDAKRTEAVYGLAEGDVLLTAAALARHAATVWCLSGTPMPNSPADLYPMMRALAPARLKSRQGEPDVLGREAFLDRYCVMRPKKISRFRSIQVVMGGRNLDELRKRLEGFMLRRTQQEVGIRPPVYELMPLARDYARRRPDLGVDEELVLAAAEAGDTKKLEMHLGPLRRLTGQLKTLPTIEAVIEELECGLDKIVLMHWHTATGAALVEGLARFGAVALNGSTGPKEREAAVKAFQTDPACRVFVGQIQAAGEAIDLSAAAELWFVETSFTPKDMAQAALRITNHSQTRHAVVRVCVLEGSIDEALQAILLRKWTAIREVINAHDKLRHPAR